MPVVLRCNIDWMEAGWQASRLDFSADGMANPDRPRSNDLRRSSFWQCGWRCPVGRQVSGTRMRDIPIDGSCHMFRGFFTGFLAAISARSARSPDAWPQISPHGTLIAAMVALAFVSGCDRATTSPVSGEGNLFAARVFLLNGNNQTGPSNVALFSPISVRVTDAGGQAVRGATIQFVVRQGGGFVSPANAVSDSIGVATTVWTLGSTIWLAAARRAPQQRRRQCGLCGGRDERLACAYRCGQW